MLTYLIEYGVRVEISYVLTNDLEKMLGYIIDFDKENKLLNVETILGEDYILPLSVIKLICIKGTGWKTHH